MKGTGGVRWLLALTLLVMAGEARAQSNRPPLAVMDLEAKNVEPLLAEAVTDNVVTALRDLRTFKVISRTEIRQMLALDRERQLVTGQCTDAGCLAEIGSALGARYLVLGSVTRLDATKGAIRVQVKLFDQRKSEVAEQQSREVATPSEAREVASLLAVAAVRPILEQQQGKLVLESAENDANVTIDGRLVGVTPLRPIALGWGPHLVVVEKKGFIAWAKDVQIERDQATTEYVTLLPSPEFVDAYRSRNRLYRVGAWTSTVLAAAGLGAAGYLQLAEVDPRHAKFEPLQKAFEQPNDTARIAQVCAEAERAGGTAGIGSDTAACHGYAKGLADEGSRYLLYSRIGLGAGLVAAGAAVYFWLAGDDPARYDQFMEANPRGEAGDAPPAPRASLVPMQDGGMALLSLDF